MNFKPNLVDTFSQVIFEGMAQVECSSLGFEKQCKDEFSSLIAMINKRADEFLEFSKK